MRTTKYDWLCFCRTFQTGGEYDPETGGVTPMEYFRQELWVKSFFRPDKDGNALSVQKVTTGNGGYYFEYTNLNAGNLFVKNIPAWPKPEFTLANGKPFTPKVQEGNRVYAYWERPSTAFDAREEFTNKVWVPIIAVSDTAVGTRFNKHYEVKVASNIQGFNEIEKEFAGPPVTTPQTVLSFEQVEQRLNTVIQIGDNIVNQ